MPSTTRRSRPPSARTLALINQAQLQRYAEQPSALEQLLKNPRPPTKRQRKIAEELYIRAGVIEGTRHLHDFTTQTISSMHLSTQSAYVHTVSSLNRLKQQTASLDEETAADVAEWTTAQKEMYRRHLSGNLEGAVNLVIGLGHRVLYLEDEPKPKGIIGWLKELSGGGS